VIDTKHVVEVILFAGESFGHITERAQVFQLVVGGALLVEARQLDFRRQLFPIPIRVDIVPITKHALGQVNLQELVEVGAGRTLLLQREIALQGPELGFVVGVAELS